MLIFLAVLAIAGLYVSGIPMMATMGWASAIMVAVSMVAAVTLLPALLGITKNRVNSVKVPFIKRRPTWDPDSTSARNPSVISCSPGRSSIRRSHSTRCSSITAQIAGSRNWATSSIRASSTRTSRL